MIGQQRQILSSLGIDLWIPRDVACQNFPQSSVWRDQTTEHIVELDHFTQAVPEQAAVPAPVVKEEPTQTHKAQVVVPESTVTALAVESKLKPETAPTQFELQLLNLSHCVIVIHATQLSVDAKQLWANIHQAIGAEYQQLNWPLPLLNLQDESGAQSYMQGFLDAHSVDKQLIVLGDLPYTHHKMLKLASLEEMLAQPILKKRLWQFIKNKN